LTKWPFSALLLEHPVKIYQLFDNFSLLSYFDHFSNTMSDSCLSHWHFSCNLAKFNPAARLESCDSADLQRSPAEAVPNIENVEIVQNAPIEWLSFECWVSVKRDIFDIPLLLYGHFLPSF
jgi:hypothetical protein